MAMDPRSVALHFLTSEVGSVGVEKPWSTEAHQEITFKVNKSAKML